MDLSVLEGLDISEYKLKRKFTYDFSSIAKYKKIQTLFLNEKLFESMTKGNLKYTELGKIIYIKNNRIAIFETSQSSYGSSSTSKYKCKLINGLLYFELIFREIACGLPSEMYFNSDSLKLDSPSKSF